MFQAIENFVTFAAIGGYTLAVTFFVCFFVWLIFTNLATTFKTTVGVIIHRFSFVCAALYICWMVGWMVRV
jgi:hypothetical protein